MHYIKNVTKIRHLTMLLFCTAFFFVTFVMRAGAAELPIVSGEGYSAVRYDITNGLPTSEANAVAETSDGAIWIGSYSGLIRYDGNTFERIDSVPGLASVVTLFTDSDDRLWIGTNDSGVLVMEKGEFRNYNKSNGLRSLSVRSIAEGADGFIYVATTHGLARVGKSMELQNVDEPQINEEYIRSIKLGADDILYGITLSGSVFTLENGKLTGFYNSAKLGIESVHSILPDPDSPGNIWLGTIGSDVYYGTLASGLKTVNRTDIHPLEYVNSFAKTGDILWICADNGIGMISGGKFTMLEDLPVTASAENMVTDYQGNLWFTSSKQGIMKIVPNQFTDLFKRGDLSEAVVNTTCMYDGKLFVGCKNDGLIVIGDSGAEETLPLTKAVSASGEDLGYTDLIEMLSGCKIRSIIRDSKNRIWISTFGSQSLLRYENGTVTRFTVDDGLPSDRIRTVIELSDGKIMAACTGGLAVIDGDKVTEIFDESSGINDPEILTVCEGAGGEIIAGTDGGGIYIINGSKTEHFGTGTGMSSDVVMRIKKDLTRDIYWIITSNSLSYMDSEHNITTVEKFPYFNNFDVYENSRDEMWVLASSGIYVVPAEQLIKNGEISCVFYSMDNGLPYITTSNSYSELTEDGNLYIAGTSGAAKVNIEKPFENVSSIKASVPYVRADDKLIYPDEDGTITIPSDTVKLTIYSSVFNYSLMNPQVTYLLDGFDTESTTVKRSELAPIIYTNLGGGDYSFVMHISDAQGRGDKELIVPIIKQKAFYEMLWFRVFTVIFAAAVVTIAVLIYIDHRTKRFLQKELENKMLIREIVEAFAKVIDMKDKYTNGHSTRVAQYTAMLTRELGYDEETVEKYYNIALLHDIGKVGIPPEVLNKPGKLTDREFAIIKSHSALGYNALKNISIMPELAIGAGAHHERPDGKGYPRGLKGNEIPRVAQIIAVADTFDAMYSDRPYRKRMNFEKAVGIVRDVKGTQLTEDVVDAFLRLVDKGEFRLPDDDGGGTTEDIDNIHRRQTKKEAVLPQ